MVDAPALIPPSAGRFGAGLSDAEVRSFQKVLERDCGVNVPLPEAWSRAIALLSLVEMLLQNSGVMPVGGESSTGFALPRS